LENKGSIRAVNLLIRDWIRSGECRSEPTRTASFAKAKLAAKFEEPQEETAGQRRIDAWSRWISFDEALQTKEILGPNWAKARLIVHDILRDFHLGDLAFTNGSSFEPLGNRTSVACKLSESWTITPDCFELFAKYSYFHRALKHAVKKRFSSYCSKRNLNERQINRKLWERFKTYSEPALEIYKFKLYASVTFVNGNRYSTVPKNNKKDRSICLEPLCNMLVQRAVGLGIRACLKDKLGIDLDVLADEHRLKISDSNVATIDLSDCSDAISIRLITYLLPRRVLNKVLTCRSDMTLGPDDNYYVVRKVSSMGNGFTFDLMTLVLTALTRSFDATSTVFGDDIICQNQVADEVISNLQVAGFVVNLDKTNVRSDYRESCGAHYIDKTGYLTTFDLRWLKTPLDLIVACNKAAILSHVYGGSFEALRAGIWSYVSRTWLGATIARPIVDTGRPPSYELDTYIRYGPPLEVSPPKRVLRSIRRACQNLHKLGRISVAIAYLNQTAPASSSLKSFEWDTYFQYVRNGRRSRKIPRTALKSTLVARVGEEQIGFARALLPVREEVVWNREG